MNEIAPIKKPQINGFFYLILYAFLAIPMLTGALLTYIHVDQLYHVTQYNQGVKLNFKIIRDKAYEVEKFRQKNNRLPTRHELSCDFKECPKDYFLLWDTGIMKNDYSLSYTPIGVMFGGTGSMGRTTYHYNSYTKKISIEPSFYKEDYWEMVSSIIYVLLRDLLFILVPVYIIMPKRKTAIARRASGSC